MPDYSGSLTVADIALRVKRQFGDEAGSQITDADITRWANDAQAEIAQLNDLLQVRALNPVAAGTAEVPLPDNMITIHTLRIDGQKLIQLSVKEFDDYISDNNSEDLTGTPTHFHTYGKTIVLYPKPSADCTLSLMYARQPIKLAAPTDVPEIPAIYHNRIVEYCMGMAYELDSDPQNQSMKMQQFSQGLMESKNNNNWENRDVYPSISVGVDDLGFNSGGGYY